MMIMMIMMMVIAVHCSADDDCEKFDHLSSTFSNDNDDILDIVIFLRN